MYVNMTYHHYKLWKESLKYTIGELEKLAKTVNCTIKKVFGCRNTYWIFLPDEQTTSRKLDDIQTYDFLMKLKKSTQTLTTNAKTRVL